MSGVKESYVNLRTSEYNRMMSACRQVDSLDRNTNERLQSAQRNIKMDMSQQFSRMEKRHQQFDTRLSSMHADMRLMDQAFNERLRQNTRAFQQAIEGVEEQLSEQRGEYISLIQEQGYRFEQAMAEQGRILQDQINDIGTHLAKKEASEQTSAAHWMKNTGSLLNLMQDTFNCKKFQPGRLQQLQDEQSLCQNSFNSGHYQAAISSAQQTYLRAQSLRTELERQTLEWNALLTVAKGRTAEILATCDTLVTSRLAIETEEGTQDIAAEIDFWTEGELSKLKRHITEEQQRFESPDNLSKEDLEQSITQFHQNIVQSQTLTARAKEALLASQLRNNIGQMIESSFLDTDWEITDSTYEGEDYRRAMHVKLTNTSGDEMVAIITPEKEETQQTIRNRLTVHFFDNDNDETFRRNRLHAFSKSLGEQGLDVGSLTQATGTESQMQGNQQARNFEQVRIQQKTAGR